MITYPSLVSDDHDEALWAEIRTIYESRERAADELLATVMARLPELRELAVPIPTATPRA